MWLIGLLVLNGCRTDVRYDGTLVGNAGGGKGQLVTTSGMSCTTPTIPISQIQLLDATGGVVYTTENPSTDLLTEGVKFPIIEADKLSLQMSSWRLDCVYEGVDVVFNFENPLIEFSLQESLSGISVIFYLGDTDWLLDTDPQQILQTQSTAWLDQNQNGRVDEYEPLFGYAEGEVQDDDQDDTDADDHDDTGETEESDDTGESEDTVAE